MKIVTIITISVFILTSSVSAQCPEKFHDFSAEDIDGNMVQMSSYAGKKVLVVNTASYCGYTYQYGELQKLYETYGGSSNPYNFEIIGFPANNFANQEPYDEDSIGKVCDAYGVTFRMMSKISVLGADQHPIYQWLTQKSRNCMLDAPVAWNFQKFMINPDGSWHGFKQTATSPLSILITNWIKAPVSLDENKSVFDDVKVYYSNDEHIVVQMPEGLEQQLKIQLFSITGKFISLLHDGKTKGTLEMSHNTSTLAPGVYLVKIAGNGVLLNRKLIIN